MEVPSGVLSREDVVQTFPEVQGARGRRGGAQGGIPYNGISGDGQPERGNFSKENVYKREGNLEVVIGKGKENSSVGHLTAYQEPEPGPESESHCRYIKGAPFSMKGVPLWSKKGI